MDGFKIFMNIYLENELSSDLIQRLFLSFLKKSEPLITATDTFGTASTTVHNTISAHNTTVVGGLFSQSNSAITGAIQSIGARLNFPSFSANSATTSSARNTHSDSEDARHTCSVGVVWGVDFFCKNLKNKF